MFNKLPTINLTARRGDNYQSSTFTFFNEEIQPGITPDELEAGISAGIYTFRDWRDYQIDADVITDGQVVFTLSDFLQVSASGRNISFAMTPAESEEIASRFHKLPGVGRYDLQICERATGQVFTIFQGTFTINDDLTKRAPCGGGF